MCVNEGYKTVGNFK